MIPTQSRALDRLLDRLHRRLTALLWMHGLGTAVGAAALGLAFAFLADWTLHLPRGVRWVELALLLGIPAALVARELVRPLRARPGRSGLAVLLDRACPEHKQLLVTAAETPRAEPGVVAAIRAEAEELAARVDPRRAFDPRGPRRRLLLGGAASVLCATLLLGNAGAARIFLARLLGGDTAWPQRTHLSIEIPIGDVVASAASALRPAGSPPATQIVRVARGTDVPVLVRAQGRVPDEVVLHLAGGQRSVLASTGTDTFRTVLRSVQEDVLLHATGGDDRDEDPSVLLSVLQPPDVASIAVAIQPPKYSGLAGSTEFDRDVEALAGSRLTVHVLPDPPHATGRARLLPEDRTLELAPAPFPGEAGDAAAPIPGAAGDPAAPRPGLAFDLVAEKSLRYRIELVDANGLENPDPGLFGISVVEDRAPEVEILSPGRGEVDTTPQGLIALRARAEDDFGIAGMGWGAAPVSETAASAATPHALEWRALPREAPAPGEDRAQSGASERPAGRVRERKSARAAALGRARIETRDLAGGEHAVEGAQIHLVVSARDNREPEAREGRSAVVHIRVVSPDEFLRRLQDRLARVRVSAASLAELQREKRRATSDLLASLESDQLLGEDRAAELTAAQTGQRRVQGDARALSRELASIVESILYARVDDRAGALLGFLDPRLDSAERGFDPAPWRELVAAHRDGALGASGLAGRLVRIAGVAFEVSEDESAQAAAELAGAEDAVDLAAIHERLAAAAAAQGRALEKVERLLELLAEWDNYQSVLALTRDILNGQKGLSERTRQYAKEH